MVIKKDLANQSQSNAPEKYVYRVYIPVGWINDNHATVQYREPDKYDYLKAVGNIFLAGFFTGVGGLAAAQQHRSSQLASAQPMLRHAAEMELKEISMGQGITGEDKTFQFPRPINISNIASTVPKSENEEPVDITKRVKGTPDDIHWKNYQEGYEMGSHTVLVVTPEEPAIVKNRGIRNGLVFYNEAEAIRCAKSDFAIPLLKPEEVTGAFLSNTSQEDTLDLEVSPVTMIQEALKVDLSTTSIFEGLIAYKLLMETIGKKYELQEVKDFKKSEPKREVSPFIDKQSKSSAKANKNEDKDAIELNAIKPKEKLISSSADTADQSKVNEIKRPKMGS